MLREFEEIKWNVLKLCNCLNWSHILAKVGGWKEIYRSQEHIPAGGLADRYSGPRATSTLIYYLITPERYSLFHRVKSDAIFHFRFGGCSVSLHYRW